MRGREILAGLRGELVIALLGVHLENIAFGGVKGMPVSAVIFLELGDQEDRICKLLTTVAQQSGGQLRALASNAFRVENDGVRLDVLIQDGVLGTLIGPASGQKEIFNWGLALEPGPNGLKARTQTRVAAKNGADIGNRSVQIKNLPYLLHD